MDGLNSNVMMGSLRGMGSGELPNPLAYHGEQYTMALTFDGKTFNHAKDGHRLSTQFELVRDLMLDGEWRTLREIVNIVGGSEASISARLRDLRKERFGSHTVERRRVDGGLHEYRLAPSERLF